MVGHNLSMEQWRFYVGEGSPYQRTCPNLAPSADLENGFGDTPESVAETLQLAAEVALVGCTIEDSTGISEHPLYDSDLAAERIAAAASPPPQYRRTKHEQVCRRRMSYFRS
jgi:2-methylisocitrate lyase-like PEP mutase family enzyme